MSSIIQFINIYTGDNSFFFVFYYSVWIFSNQSLENQSYETKYMHLTGLYTFGHFWSLLFYDTLKYFLLSQLFRPLCLTLPYMISKLNKLFIFHRKGTQGKTRDIFTIQKLDPPPLQTSLILPSLIRTQVSIIM